MKLYPYGWITPEGNFIKADSNGFVDLTSFFPNSNNTEQQAEKVGWVRVSMGIPGHLKPYVGITKLVTQSQINIIFDWCQKYGVNYPQELEEKS